MSFIIESEVSGNNEDVINLSKNLALMREKHAKYKILLDSIMEFSPKNTLDKNLAGKVKDIILSNRCRAKTRLGNDQSSQTKSSILLGLDDTEQTLNVQETKELEHSIQKILTRKYSEVSSEFQNITERKLEEVMSTPQSNNHSERKKLIESLSRKYLNNLKEQLRILEEILKLRLEKLPNVCMEKVNECAINTQVNMLKAKILEETIRIKVFYETKQSPSAYEKLFKTLINENEKYKREIEELRKLKNKYDDVSGTAWFKKLLETYVSYQASIQKKKNVLDIINGTPI